MFHASRFVTPALVLALVLPLANLVAAEPTTKPSATITGVVLNADGSPAAGVEVRAVAAAAKKKAKTPAPAAAEPTAPGDKPGEKPAEKPTKKAAAGIVTKTKADGTFTLEVPAGSYTVGVKTATGTAKSTVTVTEGKSVTVNLTLAPAAAKPAKT